MHRAETFRSEIFDGKLRNSTRSDMRTQLAPLIVVKQEFPDYRSSLLDGSENEENNNDFPTIKSENDCNNNQPEDLNPFTKKSKNKNAPHLRVIT
jgi:hypothetical protein